MFPIIGEIIRDKHTKKYEKVLEITTNSVLVTRTKRTYVWKSKIGV